VGLISRLANPKFSGAGIKVKGKKTRGFSRMNFWTTDECARANQVKTEGPLSTKSDRGHFTLARGFLGEGGLEREKPSEGTK